MSDVLMEKLRIRDLIEEWVIGRDTADWDRLRRVWHDDGWMVATWFEGPASEFIANSQASWDRGSASNHTLGGCAIDIAGDRAISQTKMTIATRTTVEDVLCDIVCVGRFYDFWEQRDGRWGLVLRQPIYEQDRIDPVESAERPVLDRAILDGFPAGYRHLAYAQTRAGFTVRRDLPGRRGPEIERLYERGAAWLAGRPLER